MDERVRPATETPPGPPKAPEIPRRPRFYRYQLIGMPIIMLVPLLGIFGLLDSTMATEKASSGDLELSVSYPSRLRFQTFEPLNVRVKNASVAVVRKLQVKLDRKYLDQFVPQQINPSPKEIDEKDVVFEMENVGPGETRQIEVYLESDVVGPQAGRTEASADGGVPVTAEFRTFVFP